MEQELIKVLIIEDNPDFIDVVRDCLKEFRKPSYTLDHTETLKEAIDRISRGSFDVFLLDLNLPDTKGLDTLRKLQHKAKHLPIIVLTGEPDESLGPEALRLGAQDYFVKTQLEPQILIRAIRYAIERKKQEESLRRAYNEIKQLLDLIPSLLIRIDPQEKILYWNDGAEKIFNIPWKGAQDKLLSECGIEWDYEILKKGILDCQVKKRPLRLEDIWFKRPDGTKGLLGVTVNPVEELETHEIGILIYGADITERRRLESELHSKPTR